MSQETNKKYIILKDEKIEDNFDWLYRIQAIKDFGDVKAGDKGGWVSGYHNLSQEGNCWIYDDACACDDSHVSDNAKLRFALFAPNMVNFGNRLQIISLVWDVLNVNRLRLINLNNQ